MKTTYHGYSVSSKSGQMDLAYQGKLDPNKPLTVDQDKLLQKAILDLKTHGVDELQRMGHCGTLDRLWLNGIIERHEITAKS